MPNLIDDDFNRAATAAHAGIGSPAVGHFTAPSTGQAWIDLLGKYNITAPGNISDGGAGSGGTNPPLNSVVRPEGVECATDGTAYAYYTTGTSVSGGITFRFNPHGGGAGYSIFTYGTNLYFWKTLDGAAPTDLGNLAHGIAISTAVVMRLAVSGANFVVDFFALADTTFTTSLFNHTFTDATFAGPGQWGLVAYDSGQFQRFRFDPAASPLSAAALGDSLTNSVHPDGSFAHPSAPDQAAATMTTGGTFTYAVNGGISGSRAIGGGVDWQPGGGSGYLAAFIAKCVASGVTVVSLMLGTNDALAGTSAAAYGSALATIVTELLNGHGITTVIIHYPPYLQTGTYAAADTLLAAYHAQINALANGSTVFVGDTQMWVWSQANPTHQGDSIHGDDVFYFTMGTYQGTAILVALNPVAAAAGGSMLTNLMIGRHGRR